MATVRYQVDGLDDNSHAHAFFPVPGLTPAAQSSLRYRISGVPGTMRVPSPRPAGAFAASTSPEWLSPSDAAPDWFAPQIWVNDISGLPVGPTASGRGIRYLPGRRAQIVPPVTPQAGVAGVAMTGRKIGGRRSMHWPRSIIRWPGLGSKE